MKSVLKLTNPLWKTPERRAILDKVVQQSAVDLESEIKQTILKSQPAGKLYRRGSITKAATKKNLALGLRPVKGNSKRVIAGSKFHRASAPGQPPAVDSGGLLNSIRAEKVSELSAKVSTSKKYAEPLDKGAVISGRNRKTKIVGPMRNRVIKARPFFGVTVEKFKPKFKKNILDAIARETS